MGKLLIFVLIIVAIWFFFFRKKKSKEEKIPKEKDSHYMIECENCKTYISKDEAIFANGKWYCSKKCLIDKD
ncbi:hypothetical protein CCY99_09010 [Helicobacter sp. 16-1353]|uniref:PP0621 family protein n=1 Tax=Helicobacter sp. 16-1353 TaxID=2004996 RepID=UPI000DCC5BA6|nr:PP0621 family protein [Helicobacter sp. 16-1353]RAX51501.1 hypothetical protein CCY99_09010 [Helicobacter sp. 16-1353]